MAYSREERIKQLQACAAGISEDAEKIVGDNKYSQALRVIIHFECGELPTVTVERQFIPQKLVEYICQGVVPMP